MTCKLYIRFKHTKVLKYSKNKISYTKELFSWNENKKKKCLFFEIEI